jgi:hypothetical protein
VSVPLTLALSPEGRGDTSIDSRGHGALTQLNPPILKSIN